ncbi:MAG: GNAT family N-acetyltransferase [Chloroflexota bacterium]|nr:GNAT family N-acetyltransferase [Chloroflexota bacterium]
MERIEIRPARSDEARAVADCVNAAYEHYVARIGKKPAPMLADYPALIVDGFVSVIPGKVGVRGVIVMMVEDDTLFIENVAVHPADQGRGLGRALMDYAEQRARDANRDAILLYTHERMSENLTFYRNLGFVEIERRAEDGYDRVYLRKRLA